MRAAALKEFIDIANATDGPFSRIVRESIEVGVVVPSILRNKLQDAGFTIASNPGAQHGSWVKVFAPTQDATAVAEGEIVAQAFSHDAADALLQAIYAELKEESRLLQHATRLLANPAFMESAEEDDKQHLQLLAQCAAKPSLMTRELLVALAGNKSLMAALAAL